MREDSERYDLSIYKHTRLIAPHEEAGPTERIGLTTRSKRSPSAAVTRTLDGATVNRAWVKAESCVQRFLL